MRITPRAVPIPPVASMPVLQCVITEEASGRRPAPAVAMALHIAASSSHTRCASRRNVFTITSTVSSSFTVLSFSTTALRSRFTAQARLTAVGRARAMVSHADSSQRSAAVFSSGSEPSAAILSAAAAIPILAATPMRGAPRTRSARMASTMASIVSTSR